MTTAAQEVLNRKSAIKEGVDPLGNQWVVTPIKGQALYLICKLDKKGEPQVPKQYPDFSKKADMSGRWTSPSRAQETIEVYLSLAWEKNEREVLEAEGRKRAAEQRALERAEALAAEELANVAEEVFNDPVGELDEIDLVEKENPEDASS